MPPIEVLVVLPALIVGVVVVCGVRWFSLRRGFRAPLAGVPTELVVAWAGRAPDPERGRVDVSSRHQKRSPSDPWLSGVEVLFQLSRLDREQLKRFETKHSANSFTELLAATNDSELDLAAAIFARSHAGEQLLAEQLREQGHDVQLAPAKKQLSTGHSGWQAWVDGHEAYLIASNKAQHVQDFLDRNSEVHVVTVADHKETFLHHALVVALDQVTSEQLEAGAKSDLPTQAAEGEVAASPAEAGERGTTGAAPGFPLGPIGSLVAERAVNPFLMTALRSAQLAAEGDTSWVSHAKHGLVDQAGGAVGGWAGARAGALAGGILGPLGAAAGGFIGGLLGKKVAQGLTDKQKAKKLNKLVARQEEFLAQIPQAASASLGAQAAHLEQVAIDLATSKDPFFWPSAGTVARREVAQQYRAWARQCRQRSQALSAWLTKKPGAHKRAQRGRKLLEQGVLGWTRRLVELRAELLYLAPQIDAEQHLLEQNETTASR